MSQRRKHRIEPYQWLGAGAIAVGIGAALASGSGVAHAESEPGTGSAGPSARSSATGATASGSAKPARKNTPKVAVAGSAKKPASAGKARSARPSPRVPSPAAPSAEVLAAALAAATRPTTAVSAPRAMAVANPVSELARERSIADINMSVGWIPGVGTVINGMSLVADFLDFTVAALNGDAADMRDEIGDMALDVVGMIPVVGAPVAATIHRATAPVVPPPNQVPSAVNDSFTTNENTQLTGNVLTNDTDPDGDVLTAAVGTGPSHGSLTLDANGSFTYTPAENFYGTDTFSYTISDGKGGNAVGTVSITVKSVDPAPVVDAQPYSLNPAGPDPVTGKIKGHFNVTDDDPLTYTVVTAPDPTLGVFELDEQTGEWSFTPYPRTRVLAGYFSPDSPAAVKLTFTITATDGISTTPPIPVSENIAGAPNAALTLPAGTVAVLPFVDPATGDAYVFGIGGFDDIFSAPDDQTYSYLVAVIHSDGSYSIPVGSHSATGVASDAFAVGDTTYVVSWTADDATGYRTYLSELRPDGLATLDGTLEGSFDDLIVVGDTTYLLTETGDYTNGYQTHLTGLGPGGLTPTMSIPGSAYHDPIVIGDTTYLVTETGNYETGYQTHVTRLGPGGVGSTTSIPGDLHEDSWGYSIVVGDITYLVTHTGDYETGYETRVTSVGYDGVVPPMSISGSATDEPIVIGDTTYLLVTPHSRIVTHVVALTADGAIPVGSIPGVRKGDPIVIDGTTYLLSETGDDESNSWQTWVTTLAPATGGITVVGDPIPGYLSMWDTPSIVVDGVTYLMTQKWDTAVGYQTYLTSLRSDGVGPVSPAILGRVDFDPVLVVGDTSYLTTTTRYYWTADGTYAYSRTFLTAMGPAGPTSGLDPVPGYPSSEPIVVGDTTYLVLEEEYDSATRYQIQLMVVTADGLTPIGDPLTGRLNSDNNFSVIVVGDTHFLAVETDDPSGAHQTTLVTLGPSGLTPVSAPLPGHSSHTPIVVGDTTYLVTQTGEYDSAQTYFTAVKPDGAIVAGTPIAGELRTDEPFVVAGDTTYVVTAEWEPLGGGSYTTSTTHVIALTPEGLVSVDYLGWASQTIVVGDITYLLSTVSPDESGGGTDSTKTYVVALTPDGPAGLADPLSGYQVLRTDTGDTTYLAFMSYPDDADGLDDIMTHVLALTADGAFVDDFPGQMVHADSIFTVGGTRYMTTTSGVWAIRVDGSQPEFSQN
ncbi:exported hypothetical protein [uncultured Mycobacterium sp.]|uniref:Outer membrane adhesin like protein n=1 Tax=uncultured Mycobacterium sp. TaxID=171292 RepID=A0A1Y5PDJ4_9MYCO|nr:exported hypothetical protein [uncultured Mycobacterium sp.]